MGDSTSASLNFTMNGPVPRLSAVAVSALFSIRTLIIDAVLAARAKAGVASNMRSKSQTVLFESDKTFIDKMPFRDAQIVFLSSGRMEPIRAVPQERKEEVTGNSASAPLS